VGVEDHEHVHLETRAEWRAWLAANHAEAPGVWLVSWKRATGRPVVGYDACVEEALCFGWIDGLTHSLGDGRRAILVTPRRKGSAWARSNKDRVDRLISEGRMTDAGLAVIDRAMADGSWSALDAAESLTEPHELSAALDANPEARPQWDAFPKSPKRALIYWVTSAKRPETRARRVALIVSEAAEGRRANF
jgi:uncharacterized protein YdeI (YjbR/CyaY-like superfamily)